MTDPDQTVVSLASAKCIDDLTAAVGRKCCELGKHQVCILDGQSLASRGCPCNQYNKYLLAVCVKRQAGD